MNDIHMIAHPEACPRRAVISPACLQSFRTTLMKINPSVVLSLAILLPACASLGTFQDMDANQDGGISREEASNSESLTGLFNSADDNDDGVLDEHEYVLVHQVITRRLEPGTGAPKRRKMMTEKGGR